MPSLSMTLLLVTVMGSVAAGGAAGEEHGFNSPFGIAVKSDGSFYVGESRGKQVSKFDASGNYIGSISEIEGYGKLKGPFDVDVMPSGNLYICDTFGHAVVVLDKDEKLLLKLGKGEPTGEPGGFHEPHFVAAHEGLGYIYVADTHNNRLQIFDMQGNLKKVLGVAGKKPGEYHFCNAVAVDKAGNVYANNWSGGFFNIYNAKWEIDGTFGRIGKKPGEFNDAYSLVIHPDGSFWVADTFSSRIQQFTAKWEIRGVIDHGEGSDLHQMSLPTDLDFDAKNNIYVADWMNNRVLKLGPDGHYLRHWGGTEALMDYEPPRVVERDPSRGKRTICSYLGNGKMNVDNAAANGVDRIFVSFNNQGGDWNQKQRIDYAHSQGVKVSASIAIYPLGSRRPEWRKRPEMYMWKKGAEKSDMLALSYFHPEVRSWKAKHLADQVAESGMDGILLDYIRYPNALAGYEPPMIDAFKQATGRDANAISPTDEQWLQFRADFITEFITELRFEIARKELDWDVEIACFVGPDWRQSRRAVVHNWRDWVQMGIVDKLMIGLYTNDFKALYEGCRQAHEISPDRTKVCMMIAAWGAVLNTPEKLIKGADVCFAADADEVGIYRGDAIRKLGLWPTIGDIARTYK